MDSIQCACQARCGRTLRVNGEQQPDVCLSIHAPDDAVLDSFHLDQFDARKLSARLAEMAGGAPTLAAPPVYVVMTNYGLDGFAVKAYSSLAVAVDAYCAALGMGYSSINKQPSAMLARLLPVIATDPESGEAVDVNRVAP